MAERTDKDVSPEEKLLNVIRGKGAAAKPREAATSAIVDESSPAEPAPLPPPPAIRSESAPEQKNRAGRPPRLTSNAALQPASPDPTVSHEDEQPRLSVADILRKRQAAGREQVTAADSSVAPVAGADALSAAPMAKKRQVDIFSVSRINWGLAALAGLIALLTLLEFSTVFRINKLDDEVANASVGADSPAPLAAAALPYDFDVVRDSFQKKLFFPKVSGGNPTNPVPPSTDQWIKYAADNLQLVARSGKGETLKVWIKDKKRDSTLPAKKGDKIDVGDVVVELKEIQSDRIVLISGRSECAVK
jgi:hypothetical protein